MTVNIDKDCSLISEWLKSSPVTPSMEIKENVSENFHELIDLINVVVTKNNNYALELKNQNDDTNELIEYYEKNVDELKSEIRTKDKIIKSLEEDLKTCGDTSNKETLESYRERLELLQQEIIDNEAKHKMEIEDIKQHFSGLDNVHDDHVIVDLKNKLKNLQDELNEAYAHQESLESQRSKLESEMIELKSALDQAILDKETSISNQNNRINELESYSESTKEIIEQKNAQIRALEERISSMTGDSNDSMVNNNVEFSDTRTDIQSKGYQMYGLEEDLGQDLNDMNISDSQEIGIILRSKNEEINKISREFDEYKCAKEKEIEAITKEYSDNKNRLSKLEDSVTFLSDELKASSSDFELQTMAYQEKIASLELELSERNKELSLFRNIKDKEYEIVERDKQDTISKMKSYEELVNKLRDELKDKTDEYLQSKSEMQECIDELRREIDNTKTEMERAVLEATKERDIATEKFNMLEESVGKSNSDNAAYIAEISNLKETIIKIERDFEKFKEDKETELNEVIKERDDAFDRSDKLENSVQFIGDELNEAISSFEIKSLEYETRIKELTHELENKPSLQAKYMNEISELKKQNEELNSEIESLKCSLDTAIKEEQEKQRELELIISNKENEISKQNDKITGLLSQLNIANQSLEDKINENISLQAEYERYKSNAIDETHELTQQLRNKDDEARMASCNLESQLLKMEEELSEKDNKISELESNYKTTKNLLDNANAEVSKLVLSIKDIEERSEETNSSNKKKEIEIRELNEKITEMQNENVILERKAASLQSELEDLKAQNSKNLNMIDELSANNKNLENTISENEVSMKENESKLIVVNTEFSDLNNQVISLSSDLKVKEDKIKELEEAIMSLNEESKFLNETIAENEKIIAKKDEVEADNNETIRHLNQKIAAITSEAECAQKEYEQKMHDMSTNVEYLNSIIEQNNDQIKNLSTKLEANEKILEEKEDDIENKQKELDLMKKRYEEIEKERESELMNRQEEIALVERKCKEIENEKHDEIECINNKLYETKNDLEEALNETNKLENRNQHLEEQIRQMNEVKDQEAEKLNEKMIKMEEELSKTSKSNDDLNVFIRKLEDDNRELSGIINKKNEVIADLKADLENYINYIKRVEDANEAMVSDVADMKERVSETNESKNSILSSYQALKLALSSSQEEIYRLTEANKEYEQRIYDLEQSTDSNLKFKEFNSSTPSFEELNDSDKRVKIVENDIEKFEDIIEQLKKEKEIALAEKQMEISHLNKTIQQMQVNRDIMNANDTELENMKSKLALYMEQNESLLNEIRVVKFELNKKNDELNRIRTDVGSRQMDEFSSKINRDIKGGQGEYSYIIRVPPLADHRKDNEDEPTSHHYIEEGYDEDLYIENTPEAYSFADENILKRVSRSLGMVLPSNFSEYDENSYEEVMPEIDDIVEYQQEELFNDRVLTDEYRYRRVGSSKSQNGDIANRGKKYLENNYANQQGVDDLFLRYQHINTNLNGQNFKPMNSKRNEERVSMTINEMKEVIRERDEQIYLLTDKLELKDEENHILISRVSALESKIKYMEIRSINSNQFMGDNMAISESTESKLTQRIAELEALVSDKQKDVSKYKDESYKLSTLLENEKREKNNLITSSKNLDLIIQKNDEIINKMETEINGYVLEIAKMQKEIDRLKSDVPTTPMTNARKTITHTQCSDSLDSLDSDLEFESRMRRLISENSSLKLQLKRKDEYIERITPTSKQINNDNVSDSMNEIEILQLENRSLTDSVKQLKNSILEKDDEIEKLRVSKEGLEKELFDLYEQKMMDDQNRGMTNADGDDANDPLGDFQPFYKVDSSQMFNDLQKSIQDEDVMTNRPHLLVIKELQSMNARFKIDIEGYKMTIMELEEKIEKYKQNVTESNGNNLDNFSDVISNENEILKGVIMELISELGIYDENTDKLTIANLSYDNYKDLMASAKMLKDKYQELKDKNKEIEEETDEYKNLVEGNVITKRDSQHEEEVSGHEVREQNENIVYEEGVNKESEMKKENDELKNKIEKLEREILEYEDLKEENRNMQNRIKQFECDVDKYNEVKRENEELRSQIEENNEEIRKYMGLLEENKNLQDKIRQVESDINENNELKRENEKFKVKIKELGEKANECNAMKRENEEFKVKIKELGEKANENNELKRENEEFKVKIKELGEKVNECNAMKRENDELKNRIKKIEEEITKYESIANENLNLQSKIKQIEKDANKNNEIKRENEELKDKIELLKEEVREYNIMKSENENFKDRYRELEEEISRCYVTQRENEELRNKNKELEVKMNEYKNISEENLSLRRKIKQIEEEFVENNEMKREYNELKNKIREFEEENLSLFNRIKQIEEEVNENNEIKKEYEELKNINRELEEKNLDLLNKIKHIEEQEMSESNEIKRENIDLRNKNMELEKEISEYKYNASKKEPYFTDTHQTDLKVENDRLREKIEELMHGIQESEQRYECISKMQDKVIANSGNYRKILEVLKNSNEELENRNIILTKEVQNLATCDTVDLAEVIEKYESEKIAYQERQISLELEIDALKNNLDVVLSKQSAQNVNTLQEKQNELTETVRIYEEKIRQLNTENRSLMAKIDDLNAILGSPKINDHVEYYNKQINEKNSKIKGLELDNELSKRELKAQKNKNYRQGLEIQQIDIIAGKLNQAKHELELSQNRIVELNTKVMTLEFELKKVTKENEELININRELEIKYRSISQSNEGLDEKQRKTHFSQEKIYDIISQINILKKYLSVIKENVFGKESISVLFNFMKENIMGYISVLNSEREQLLKENKYLRFQSDKTQGELESNINQLVQKYKLQKAKLKEIASNSRTKDDKIRLLQGKNKELLIKLTGDTAELQRQVNDLTTKVRDQYDRIKVLQAEKLTLTSENDNLHRKLISTERILPFYKSQNHSQITDHSTTGYLDTTQLALQNKNLISLFHSHFKLINHRMLLAVSKQISQFNNRILTLNSKIAYMQNKIRVGGKSTGASKTLSPSSLEKDMINNKMNQIVKLLGGKVRTGATQLELCETILLHLKHNISPKPRLLLSRTCAYSSNISGLDFESVSSDLIISELSPVLGVNITTRNQNIAIAIIQKAKKVISKSRKTRRRYDDARKILSTIQELLNNSDGKTCLNILKTIFSE